MFGGRVIGGPRELGDVQIVFVAIDHQRHLGDILFVEPVAGDAHLRGPPPQMPRPLGQSRPEDLGLLPGLGRETAKDRTRGWAGRGPRKSEIRMSKSETISNDEEGMFKTVSVIPISVFGFVSGFSTRLGTVSVIPTSVSGLGTMSAMAADTVSVIPISNFEFVSDFGFRISDFRSGFGPRNW